MTKTKVLFFAVSSLAIACGPEARDNMYGNCEMTGAEVCGDGLDNDCDGNFDCDDTACSTSAECASANCGTLERPEGSLALPDGEGNSYRSSINFTGFSDGQTLDDVSKVLGACVVMEHTWLRDLQIELTCPNGTNLVLQQFLGQEGNRVIMGQPVDEGFDPDPVPGVGAEYCWSPSATRGPMLDYATAHSDEYSEYELPPGDYNSVTPMSRLEGYPLNGEWTLKVTDLWEFDNGFIFSWSMHFDPSIVEDCSDWPVE
jgi:hypothetical protein